MNAKIDFYILNKEWLSIWAELCGSQNAAIMHVSPFVESRFELFIEHYVLKFIGFELLGGGGIFC